MKELRWDLKKNERLKRIRGVSFEDLVNTKLISILEHPTRRNQKIMLFEFKKYIWAVPFVEEEDYYFLKTLFPSRKYTKQIKGE
jgi:uncharacterized DUF497 family protein